jgi:hypothetical protein
VRRAIAVELRVSADDSDCIEIKTIDHDRITHHGFGSFLAKYDPSEVGITDAARERLLEGFYKRGLQGMEIFDHNVLAWGDPNHWIHVPFANVSIHGAGAKDLIRQFARIEE